MLYFDINNHTCSFDVTLTSSRRVVLWTVVQMTLLPLPSTHTRLFLPIPPTIEEVQVTEALTVKLSDLASLSTNTLFFDLSAANPFKLFIWKKYAFIIVFLITPNRKTKGMP